MGVGYSLCLLRICGERRFALVCAGWVSVSNIKTLSWGMIVQINRTARRL
jgi:hypothetical protein